LVYEHFINKANIKAKQNYIFLFKEGSYTYGVIAYVQIEM